MVQTIRNRYVAEQSPETPAVPTQAPLAVQASSQPIDVESFADSILAQTEDRIPDDLSKFIDDAAAYEETQKDKMKRYARADLESRRGSFIASPFLRTAAVKIGETAAALGARMTGHEEAANRVHRLAAAYTEAQQEMNAQSTYPGLPDVVARETLNVGTEITAQAPYIALAALSGGGTSAIIAEQALATADQSYTQALDAGKSEREAAQHAIGMGVIEGGVTAAFSMIGLGGLEKFAGPGASKPLQAGVRQALKYLGIETMSELTEEMTVQFGQSLVSWMDGVDPEAMTWDRWKKASKDIFLQTVATMGLYAAPGIAAGRAPEAKVRSLQDKIVSAAEEVSRTDQGISRQRWAELGFSRETGETEAERTAVVEHIADQVAQAREVSGEQTDDQIMADWVRDNPSPDLRDNRPAGLGSMGVPKWRETYNAELAKRRSQLGQQPPATSIEPDAAPTALDQALQLAPQEATPTAAEQAVSPEQAPVEAQPETITTPMGEEVAPDAGVQEQAAFDQVAPREEADLASTANRITAQIREGFSLPGLEAEPAETQAQWVEEARARMDANPHWVKSVVNDVVTRKRAPTPVENAGLTLHMRRLKNDIQDRVRLIDDVEAPDEGKAAAQTEAELLITDLDEVLRASEMGGTAAGRALASRRLTLDQNYEIGDMLSRERVMRKRPLTQKEISEVTALAKEIETLRADLAKEQAKAQERVDNEGLDAAIAQARKPRRQPSARKKAATARRKASVQQFRSALNNLESFRPSVKNFLKGESGAVSVPVELIEAAVEMVKAHVSEGVVTFSEFWGDVRADVGEFNNSREVFRQAWERVRENGGIEQTAIKPDQYREISKYANRMLDAVVKSGETDRNTVLSEVHDELARVVQGIDRRSVLDAITRQGNYTPRARARTEAQKNAADVRKQLRLVRRLEQLMSGKIPKGKAKSPAEVSAEIEVLKQQIREAEASSLVLQYRKTRDIERKLRNRLIDVIDRKKKSRKPTPEMEAEEARLKSEIATAQKVTGLEDKLAAIQRGEVPGVKAKTEKGEDSPEVRSLKEQITKAEADSPTIQKARAESREKTYTKTLEDRLAEYNRQLSENDVAPKKRGKTPESKRISDLQYEIEIAKGKVKIRRERLRVEGMNRMERAWHELKKVLHTQRTVMLSLDLPLLRQGAFYAYSHPVRAAHDLLTSLQAWKSDKGYFEVMQSIKDRPNWDTYGEMGISFTEMQGDFTTMEEDYAGGYLEDLRKIAGVRHGVNIVAASGRGHSALMNLIRAGYADLAIESFGGKDGMTIEQKRVLGRLVNVTTGRGELGSMEKHAEAAALVFLAPRYVVSRFQQAITEPAKAVLGVGGHDAKTRAFFLKEYGKSFAGWIAITAMLQAAFNFMSDDEEQQVPEVDTRSSTFGKVRVGNTLLDMSGGVSQTSVLLSRVWTGEYKNLKGEVKPLRGPDVKYGDYNMEDVLDRFARYKFAPWLSFSYDVATGKTGGGFEDVTAGNLAKNYLIPIPVNDVVKSTEDLGIPRAIVVTAIMEAGSGMQTYDTKSEQKGVVPNPFATD